MWDASKTRRGLSPVLLAGLLVTGAGRVDADLDYLPPDDAHGDWSLDTFAGPSTVAEYVVRVGDIDNFSTGWDLAFRPFYGKPARAFKQAKTEPDDPEGIDLDQWPAADKDDPDAGSAIRLGANFFPLAEVDAARITLFVGRTAKGDAPLTATLNGQDAPFIAEALMASKVPVGEGRLINLAVPQAYLQDLALGSFVLTLAHEPGDTPYFAVDFAACYLNPGDLHPRATVSLTGQVVDRRDGVPLSGLVVQAAGHTIKTDDQGRFTFTKLPAGHTIVHLGKPDRRVSHALDLPGDRTLRRTLAY